MEGRKGRVVRYKLEKGGLGKGRQGMGGEGEEDR